MTLRFRRHLEELLEEWCPEQGMAALLLEHATPGVYFPLVVKPFSVATDYYSLPLRFTTRCERDVRLDEGSSPEQLAFRGRLELTQPDLRLPVRQEVIHLQAGREEEPSVLLLRSSPGDVPPLDERNLTTLRHLVPLTCQNWIEHAQDFVDTPEVRDLEGLARDIVRRLSDEAQDPPYFPILHAEVYPDADGAGGRRSSVNLLSWNCFLLDNQRGVPSYVREMPGVMRRHRVGRWWDDVTRRADFRELPESIRNASLKTIDQVHVLGRCEHGSDTWWAFARHDKDRSRMEGLFADWGAPVPIRPEPDARGEVEPLSPGDLVRRALTVKAAPDDVLMTTWLVSESGQGINIGFRAGRRIEVLDQAEVGDRHPIEILDFAPFRVRLSPLPLVERDVIERRVRPVLESAARAARQIDGSALLERAFEPVRRELHQGSWHDHAPAGGLFPEHRHDVADWTEADFDRCHARLAAMVEDLLAAWTGRAAGVAGECPALHGCWHIRAAKALAHERLHASLLLAALGGGTDEAAFAASDREICFEGDVRWPEVLAALQTVVRKGHRFRLRQCFHGRSQTLILRFSGELNQDGVVAALSGDGAQKRKGSFTRACETLRRAARRFGVEVTHDNPPEGRWGIVVELPERELSC